MTRSEFRSAAKEYVIEALSESEGRKPSQKKIKKAVNQIVKALAPVVVKKTGRGPNYG